MSGFCEQALEKLKTESASVRGNKEGAMKDAVRKTLEDFCRQDEEFAQAVVQGGSFADCMAGVAKGVGTHISDIEAYRRAVQFYFSGAEIRVQMSVDLCGGAAEEPEAGQKPSGILLDFTQFL